MPLVWSGLKRYRFWLPRFSDFLSLSPTQYNGGEWNSIPCAHSIVKN